MRYMQYTVNEIPVDCIAPIRQYWINDILDLIPAEYKFLDRVRDELISLMSFNIVCSRKYH